MNPARLDRRDWRFDAGLAVVVGGLEIVGTYAASLHQSGRRPLDILGVALLAGGALALTVRRRRPVAVLAVVFATTLAYSLIRYADGPIWLPLIIAFGTVVLTGHRRVAQLSLVAGYLSFLWLGPLLGRWRSPTLAASVGLGAWLAVLLTVAELIRLRRDRAVDAARTREEESRRRASDERLRIARELHDVLAHNISLINVQASTALHLIDDQPERARTALAAIKEVSKETLVEVRSVLGILRQDDEVAPRSPTAGLAGLDDLVGRTRAAGLSVAVHTSGRPGPLSSGVDLAAYRILQEALTNVVRHAAARSATVQLTYGPADLVVQVDDDGRGRAGDGHDGGNGIPGMRERAAALGGTLQAGTRAGGGFRVRAWLPVDVRP